MAGHIEPRGPNTWRIFYDAPRGEDGKRKQKSETVKGTKKQADARLREILREIDLGRYVEPIKLTLGAYLVERWLPDYAKPRLSGVQYQRCEWMVKGNIQPVLGHLHLDKLTPTVIQQAYSFWLERGRKDGKGGLDPKTVLNIHRLIKQSLGQAVKWQLLSVNHAAAVEPPRPPREEMHAFTEVEIACLLAACNGRPLQIPVLLGLTTGMRRGEILGLRWQDVDLKNGTLAVRQSLEETKAGLAFKQPKTPKSRREISLLSLTVDALVQHRADQDDHRRLLGAAYEDQDLVIARPGGRPMRPAYLTLAFRRLAAKLALASTRLHDLRHTHASQLLKAGVHVKIVSERLGHSTVAMTMDVYSHLLPGMQEDAARRLDAMLRAVIVAPDGYREIAIMAE